MAVGGYQIVDFKNKRLIPGDGGTNIEGIYNSIKNSNNKALLVCGLNVDGFTHGNFFTEIHFYDSENQYRFIHANPVTEIDVYSYVVVINYDDNVYVVEQ